MPMRARTGEPVVECARAGSGAADGRGRGIMRVLLVEDYLPIQKAIARGLREAGYRLAATRGTARTLKAAGISVKVVNKLQEGRPNVLDLMRNDEIQLVINVPRGRKPKSDGFYIREDAARHGIPCLTDLEVAMALVRGLRVCSAAGWDMDACGTRVPGTCLAEGAGGK